MAIPKYKKQFQDMLEINKELFDKYMDLEASYMKDKSKFKEELEETKRQVLLVIRRNENKLCARTENTKFGMFSTNLADKFWEEVVAYFPKINDAV